MQRIPLSLAKPGMKLAKAVLNEKGLILCSEGTEIDEMLISSLAGMDIQRVTVEGHPVDTGAEVKSLEELLYDLEKRFVKVASDPLMKTIKGIMERQLRKKMGKKE